MTTFTNASAVTIREKAVEKLALDGETIWEKNRIINWLPLATDTDRTTVYNGTGYKIGTRLSSSGDTAENASYLTQGMCTSGFIPAQPGDVLRIRGFDPLVTTNYYVIAYNAANVKTGYANVNSATSPYTITLNSSTFGTDFNAIRFCVRNLSAESFVTINQELP